MPVTRRALLGVSTATLGVVALTALAEAGGVVADPDTPLFDLIARHDAVVAEQNAHPAVHEAAESAFKAAAPHRPEALTSGFGDTLRLQSATGRDSRIDGRPQCYFTPGDVERLRAAGSPTLPNWDDDGAPLPGLPDPRRSARQLEIVTGRDEPFSSLRPSRVKLYASRQS